MKKVLVFATTFPKFTPGDATPPFVYELSKRLAITEKWQEELQITVLTPRVPGANAREERDGLTIIRYPYFFRSAWEKLNDGAILPNIKQNKWLAFQAPFLVLCGLFILVRTARREKTDIIHAHWIIPGGLIAVIAKKFFGVRAKIVCTSHGGDIFWLRWSLGTSLKKAILCRVDLLTVVSYAIKSECVRLGAEESRISVLPMGVDTEVFHPDTINSDIQKKYGASWSVLLFVGRLAEKKWLRYLIEAMPAVLHRYPDTKLLIIWHWPLEYELRQQMHALGLEGKILFLGAIPNSELHRYYSIANIFVGPSVEAKDGDSEWFGLVFVEAILSGCVTIGSNLHGITDIIQPWVTGFLVEQRNSADLSGAIIAILSWECTLNVTNARKVIANKFGWNPICDRYRWLYRMLGER